MMSGVEKTVIAISLIISVCTFGLSWAASECYVCGPTEKGCDNPLNSSTPLGSIQCRDLHLENFHKNRNSPSDRVFREQIVRAAVAAGANYSCASVYVYNSTDQSNTGIFRTCVIQNEKENNCDLLRTIFEDAHYGKVQKCLICNEDRCNKYDKDYIMKNSGEEVKFTSIITLTVISFWFVRFVLI